MDLEIGTKYRLKLKYMPSSFDAVYKGQEEFFEREYHRFVLKEGFAFVYATDDDIEDAAPITD